MSRRKVAFGVAVVLVVAGTATWFLLRPDDRPPLPEPAHAYEVLYRVETVGGDRIFERVVVRRPFDQRVVSLQTRDGPEGETAITNREWFWSIDASGEVRLVTRRAPGAAPRLVSVGALRSAVDAGVAVDEGTAEVAGEPCERYAFREPGPADLAPPVSGERVTLCVTPDGIPVEEVWLTGGEIARRRTAVSIERDPDTADERFAIGRDPEATEVAGVLGEQRTLQEDVAPSDPPPADLDAPGGFTRDRRATVASSGGSLPARAFYETYRSGDLLVVVSQGTESLGGIPWEASEGRLIELDVGDARIVYLEGGVEVRLVVGDRWFRVVAPSEALAESFANRLEV